MAHEMFIGLRADDDAPLTLAPSALLRHVMALGSSGSGKTVFCKVVVEEAVRAGIPAICVDPQGDLASFGAGVLDPAQLEAHGVDPALAASVAERAEVIVLTPGSSRGLPLAADPVDPSLADLEGGERVDAISRTASMVVGLLGFELDSDDGAGLAAVFDRALGELLEAGVRPSLARLTEHLLAAQERDFEGYARYLDARKIRVAGQRLARLDVGARRALFHDGVPIDIDVLLGRDSRAPVADGKVRIAVIYLNTLHQQEDKDFFVAALADRLYAWMLANPSPAPQALFYIDEVAPFVPPVRKPACKEGLSLLFKQARKYGVGCLMATQNPGDVDYRAMAQFGTWALGRLTTRQDLKKVEPTLTSLAPGAADAILGRLPSLKPGEMVLLSPDQLGAPVEIRTRWLATRHETWTEERVEAHTDPLRARFSSLIAAPEPEAAPSAASPVDRAPPAPPVEPERAEWPAPSAPEQAPAELPPVAPRPSRRAAARDAEVLAALVASSSSTVSELAATIERSEATVRRALARLVESGEARAYGEGRARRYFAPSTGARPDLGMPAALDVLRANIDEEAASRIARAHARSSVLGLIGDDERFERAEPLHRLVYKLAFEEKVQRSRLARLFGRTYDERVGNLYLHPHTLAVLVFTNDSGIAFDDAPGERASDIHDLEGKVELQRLPPGALTFDAEDWTAKKPEDAVRERVQAQFVDVTPGVITPLFVPLWQLYFRGAKGNLRRVTIDALIGRRVQWPDIGG